ncbi:hypothetical protein [Lascolabacillus massiliensis]|uniref:hypothetical protein n=1 Tax=Lascolabacillus massiliensis TaxID=1627894 RepID=UPI0012B88FEC|nr:hypothetical protein [Lascolabacillus massiliensis]
MKQRILAKDKKIIISGLKTGTFNITELNHLTRGIADHSGDIELFGKVEVALTMDDKRNLLKSLRSGYIDFELIPDLFEKIKENFFLRVMIESTSIES